MTLEMNLMMISTILMMNRYVSEGRRRDKEEKERGEEEVGNCKGNEERLREKGRKREGEGRKGGNITPLLH